MAVAACQTSFFRRTRRTRRQNAETKGQDPATSLTSPLLQLRHHETHQVPVTHPGLGLCAPAILPSLRLRSLNDAAPRSQKSPPFDQPSPFTHGAQLTPRHILEVAAKTHLPLATPSLPPPLTTAAERLPDHTILRLFFLPVSGGQPGEAFGVVVDLRPDRLSVHEHVRQPPQDAQRFRWGQITEPASPQCLRCVSLR